MDAVPPRHRPRAEALLARLAEHGCARPLLGPTVPGSDYERAWETRFRLAAALEAFPEALSAVSWTSHTHDPLPVPRSGHSAPEAVLTALAGGMRHPLPVHQWGPGPETLAGTAAARQDVFPYWENPGFLAHAGREHLVCGMDPDDGSLSLKEAARRLADAGHTRFFVKGARSKSLVLTGTHHPHRGFAPDDEDAGWELVRLEGRGATLVLQPFLPMTHEYRFTVVAGVPVSGAGRVLEHTPFDSTGKRFETVLREVPGAPLEELS
ncbi:hypothetical protein ACX8Z9_04610 [Arthrobacter halodurans]|uniref:Phytanoyl-CoA dioxygenase (PhyH) n=1 Tax=Arthrobacter halodurans TaxID=516699 RepID=A0ABV4URK1_9MICC